MSHREHPRKGADTRPLVCVLPARTLHASHHLATRPNRRRRAVGAHMWTCATRATPSGVRMRTTMHAASTTDCLVPLWLAPRRSSGGRRHVEDRGPRTARELRLGGL